MHCCMNVYTVIRMLYKVEHALYNEIKLNNVVFYHVAQYFIKSNEVITKQCYNYNDRL